MNLSRGLARRTGYEEYPNPSRSQYPAARTGRVPRPLARPFFGAARDQRSSNVPHRAAHRASQQEHGLERRRQRYVVAVRADFAVTTSPRGVEPRRADVLVAARPARSWRSVTWREGSRGWMRGSFVASRGWRVTSPSGL